MEDFPLYVIERLHHGQWVGIGEEPSGHSFHTIRTAKERLGPNLEPSRVLLVREDGRAQVLVVCNWHPQFKAVMPDSRAAEVLGQL